jgi:ABC-type transporter Mla maintaining outer membrane lipid asymmetry ATPase subunit MlaF
MKIDSRLRAADLTFERGGRRILDSIAVQFASGSVTVVLGEWRRQVDAARLPGRPAAPS